ncbi:hypothetical protein [Candidatus Poriferisodalis sp.]|uniref:hypothetical protein n=1 Tax=Candidatus Poriferisodalis sp. TaxID=3101277 RepID=UPI003B02D9C2
MNETPKQLEELQHLVLMAFRTAAQQQKPEWYRMQGCVLKNRLLNQTDRSFNERDYGAENFSALLTRIDDLVETDHSVTPYMVELRESLRSRIEPEASAEAAERTQRIRADLWHAIIDYSSGRNWAWDRSRGLAVDAQSAGMATDELWMPTLDESDLREWRARFAESSSERMSDIEANDLNTWVRTGLGTDALPRRLRGPWNGWMKREVLERLLAFFTEHEIEAPTDLLVSHESRQSPVELRTYISKCIALMSEDELRELRIPADVAMRAHR